MYTIQKDRYYEVGNYKPNGTFLVLERYESKEDAQKMIRYLNGGNVEVLPKTHEVLKRERKEAEEAQKKAQEEAEERRLQEWRKNNPEEYARELEIERRRKKASALATREREEAYDNGKISYEEVLYGRVNDILNGVPDFCI